MTRPEPGTPSDIRSCPGLIVTSVSCRAPCRAELERFLARERELGRQDLILPVYYVSTPQLDDPLLRDADELARVVASRQLADWRELRFEPFTSPGVRRAVGQLAARVRGTGGGGCGLRPVPPPGGAGGGAPPPGRDGRYVRAAPRRCAPRAEKSGAGCR